MRKSIALGLVFAALALVAIGTIGKSSLAQTAAPAGQGAAVGAGQATAPLKYKPEDVFLRWALPPGAQAYSAIDGKRMHQYVVEQAEIGRRYRDQGHPQFWGRIIGTSADAESAQWVANKFKQAGLSEIKIQSLDLIPQWMAQSWEVSVTGGGKTLRIDGSAQPNYGSVGTSPQGLDLEAVYAGLGSEADFAGRDVRGKAVFVITMLRPVAPSVLSAGAVQRAEEKGAAAVFNIMALQGNHRYQSYPARGSKIPTFTLGMEDGLAVRDLIGAASAQPPRIKIRLDAKPVPDMKTAIVWGKLPGTTDETVYIIAHRDGWFDAATDNASGVATLVGLAEHFAKVPQAQRRRTMVFLGLDGHHNTGNDEAKGSWWLAEHKDEFFSKTALMINAEHTSTIQTALGIGATAQNAAMYTPQQWYAGGPSRPKLQEIALKAFREFGVVTYVDPAAQPPAGDLYYAGGAQLKRFVPGVQTSDYNVYFHTDAETPETVPWTGLEATTRAYARIVDEVNKLDLADLKRPEEPLNQRPGAAPTAAPPTAGQVR